MAVAFEKLAAHSWRLYGNPKPLSSTELALEFDAVLVRLRKLSAGASIELQMDLRPLVTTSINQCKAFLADIRSIRDSGLEVTILWHYDDLPPMDALADTLVMDFDPFVQKAMVSSDS